MFNDRYGLTQAVLEGRKTMTRRIIKAPKRINGYDTNGFIVCQDIATHEVTGIYVRGYDGGTIDDIEILPKYEIGEVVAVAQSYRDVLAEGFESDAAVLRAFEQRRLVGWTNKMFVRPELMPHRIRITKVRIERLQDISDEDCLHEGIFEHQYYSYGEKKSQYGFDGFLNGKEGWFAYKWYNTPHEAFAALIDKVSGRGTWDRNPYVVAYEFELLR